jgi:Tol biopolymer transport system component
MSGLDFGMIIGTKVLAVAAGQVTYTGPGYDGLKVSIDHGGGFGTEYWHLSSINPSIQPGTTVCQGANLGDSGGGQHPHLHLEFRNLATKTGYPAHGISVDGYTARGYVRIADGLGYNYQGTMTKGTESEHLDNAYCEGNTVRQWFGSGGTVTATERGSVQVVTSTNQVTASCSPEEYVLVERSDKSSFGALNPLRNIRVSSSSKFELRIDGKTIMAYERPRYRDTFTAGPVWVGIGQHTVEIKWWQSGTEAAPLFKQTWWPNRLASAAEPSSVSLNSTPTARPTFPAGPTHTQSPQAGGSDIIAYVGPDSNIWTISADGSTRTRLTNDGKSASPSWAPDGQQLVFASRRSGRTEIYLIPASGGEAAVLTQGSGDKTSPAWSPDGTAIAYASGGRIFLLDPQTRKAELLYDTMGSGVGDLAWSPDSRVLGFTETSGTGVFTQLAFVDRATRAELADDVARASPCGENCEPAAPRWAPDGRTLAFVAIFGGQHYLGGSPLPTVGPARRDVYALVPGVPGSKRLLQDGNHPDWSPDGKRLAFSRASGTTTNVWVANSDGSGARHLIPGDFPVWQPAHSAVHGGGASTVTPGPGTTLPFPLLYLDAAGRLMSLGVGAARDVTSDRAWPIQSFYEGMAAAPGGRWVAFAVGEDEGPVLFLIDTMTGQGRSWPAAIAPRWSSDGAKLAYVRLPVTGVEGYGGPVHIVDLSTGDLSAAADVALPFEVYNAYDWAGSNQLVGRTARGGLASYQVETRKTTTLKVMGSEPTPWSCGDGRRVAVQQVVGKQAVVQLFDLQTGSGREIGRFPLSAAEVGADFQFATLPLPYGSWAPACDVLAYAPDGQPGIQIYDIATSRWRTVPGASASRPFFSPDGRWLVYTVANRIRLLDVGTGQAKDIVEGFYPQWLAPPGVGYATALPTIAVKLTSQPSPTRTPMPAVKPTAQTRATSTPVVDFGTMCGPSTATRIRFQPGGTSAAVSVTNANDSNNCWVLAAAGGQTLSVRIARADGPAILDIWGRDGEVLLTNHVFASSFSGTLPSTQDYYIVVDTQPSTRSYTLEVSIPPLGSANSQSGKADTTHCKRATRIQFARGAISAAPLRQAPPQPGGDCWVLKASAGQTMSLSIVPDMYSGYMVLRVHGANGTVLLSERQQLSDWSGRLPATQDYYIMVIAVPDDVPARGYILQVTIPPRP